MILWLTLSTALAASGQASSLRGIEGTVRDISGTLLAGALVTATSVETGMRSVTTSNRRDGSFTISDLALGKYRVTVQLDGYLTQTQEPVIVWAAHVFSQVSFVLTFPPPEPVTVGGNPLSPYTIGSVPTHSLKPLPRGLSFSALFEAWRSR